MKARLISLLLWLQAQLIDGLITVQEWFDHQNGYDQTPRDWKGPR
jgi:hypothetical protein